MTSVFKLTFLVLLFNYIDSAVIQNFTVPQTVRNGDTFFVNCTYTLNTNEWLTELSFTKDNQLFYRYNNASTLISITGINAVSVDLLSFGRLRVRNANSSSAGVYRCSLHARTQTVWSNSSTEARVAFVSANLTSAITYFSTPSTIRVNDTYWVNCTYALASGNYLNVFTLSKDSRVFYSFNNATTVTSIPGVTNTTIYGTALIRVSNATADSKGSYTCLLSYRNNLSVVTNTSHTIYVNSVKTVYASKIFL